DDRRPADRTRGRWRHHAGDHRNPFGRRGQCLRRRFRHLQGRRTRRLSRQYRTVAARGGEGKRIMGLFSSLLTTVRPAGLRGALLAALASILSQFTPAFAGDTASLDVLGYSPDGKVFAFEEYGIADGSGFPYSNIYF